MMVKRIGVKHLHSAGVITPGHEFSSPVYRSIIDTSSDCHVMESDRGSSQVDRVRVWATFLGQWSFSGKVECSDSLECC